LKGRVRGLVGRGLKKSFPVTQSAKMLDPPLVTSTFSEKQYYLAKENVDSIETLLIDHFSFLFTAFQVNIPFHKLTLAMFSISSVG